MLVRYVIILVISYFGCVGRPVGKVLILTVPVPGHLLVSLLKQIAVCSVFHLTEQTHDGEGCLQTFSFILF